MRLNFHFIFSSNVSRGILEPAKEKTKIVSYLPEYDYAHYFPGYSEVGNGRLWQIYIARARIWTYMKWLPLLRRNVKSLNNVRTQKYEIDAIWNVELTGTISWFSVNCNLLAEFRVFSLGFFPQVLICMVRCDSVCWFFGILKRPWLFSSIETIFIL